MTTDITNTEIVVEQTPAQIAEEFIKDHSFGDLVDEFVNHFNTIESLKKRLEYSGQIADRNRAELLSVRNSVEEFLKEHISENDSASVAELKELAEELDIELTKSVCVTFTVEVTAEITVPLDFDEEEINDGDFNIDIEYRGNQDDVECQGVDWDINDFSVDEN